MTDRNMTDDGQADRSDDKFFWSPDAGRLVQRGAFLYNQYGEVIPAAVLWQIRTMSVSDGSHDNYADWTEEHRHEVHEAAARKFQFEESEQEVRLSRRKALVEQARLKLTKEEFDAVYDQGFGHGRE